MAFALPNTYNNNNSNNNNNGEGYANSNYVLKDSIRSDWYIYRASDKSIVRPYPVYDAAGNPCPITAHPDPENPYSIFSEAFAIIPLVSFAGLDGRLQFIDYCTDMQQYEPVGSTLTRTPYSFFVTKVKEMLPEKDKQTTKSGLPTPGRLAQVKQNIHYAMTSLVFRGATLKSRGKSSASKQAVNGMLFKTVFYVSTKSAIDSLVAELQKPKDPRQPWSIVNSAADGLFDLDGLTMQFDKTGPQNADPYRASFGYSPEYAATAKQFFQISDPSQYHSAVRAMFGQFQNISDIFHLMTVGEMVALLKEKYPISWVYYGLKDSPYAGLLTPGDREAAMQDPEMQVWFGLAEPQATAAPSSPSPMYSHPSMPTAPQGYTQYSANPPYTTNPPYPNSPAPTPPIQQTAPTQPTFESPGYAVNTPMGSSPQSMADYWRARYSSGNAGVTEEDSIRM